MTLQNKITVMRGIHILPIILLVGSGALSGCERPSTDTTVAPSPTTIPPVPQISVSGQATETQPSSYPKELVSPQGYQGVRFGDTITPEYLTAQKLIPPNLALENASCYFTSHSVKTAPSDALLADVPASLYQIIDNKVALIRINDTKVPFYTGVKIGDSAAKVWDAHQNNLSYELDKYDGTGNHYELITAVNPQRPNSNTGQAKPLNLQIKYKMQGGQKLNQNSIMPQAWSPELQGRLKGQVISIEIGEPEVISLVEGCS
ncbi:MAG: hypothetical protein Q4P13_06315 [Psychrobacter sp.]|nr:hypothetical protein [Psychrobacter sp.]